MACSRRFENDGVRYPGAVLAHPLRFSLPLPSSFVLFVSLSKLVASEEKERERKFGSRSKRNKEAK